MYQCEEKYNFFKKVDKILPVKELKLLLNCLINKLIRLSF